MTSTPTPSAPAPAGRVDGVIGVAFVVFWSSGFVGAALSTGPGELVATNVLAWRYVVLVVLLSTWCVVRRIGVGRAGLRRQVALGLTNQVIYLGCIFTGVQHGVDAGLAALIATMQPLVVAALSGPVLGQRVGRAQVVGLVLALAGVALVVGGELGTGDAPWWAYPIPVVGMLALSCGSLLERRWRPTETISQVLLVQSWVGLVAFVALAAVLGELEVPPTAIAWSGVIWLVVLSTLGGYSAFVTMLRRRGPLTTSTLLYLTPPTTMVWAWLMFGDVPTVLGYVGTAVVAVGVVIALGAARAQARRRPR